MLKLIWVPKKYKNLSYSEIVENARSVLKECEEAEKRNALLYADIMILQNKIANLTEEEARHNLEVLIPWLESQFPSLKNEF
ncbi:hypothetical protein ACTXNW_07840 [Enterococcus malodoratus]|uniref:hypothetical protein n=1 Tax=Enterococcus malodoratus TaxID=71451 RepID=UPI003FD063A7